MKLILMTLPYFFVEEHQILNALFEEGLECLHLRKPNTEPVYSERLLSLIQPEFHKRIVVHDHFYLKQEYNLLGIHLSSRNPNLPIGYKGHLSCSCRTEDEVKTYKNTCNYVFFYPVFGSTKAESLPDGFDESYVNELSRRKVFDKKVMALGGINLNNIHRAKELGFGGVVVVGDLWNRFDIHSNQDYKELVSHFRKLKKTID